MEARVGLFGKFFGSRRDEVPEWARFFTPEQYSLFAQTVLSDLTRRDLVPEIGDGIVNICSAANSAGHSLTPRGVEVLPEGAGKATLGLLNLAQLCLQLRQEEWPACVRAHFDNCLSTDQAMAGVDTMSVEEARVALRVRLMSDEVIAATQGMAIHRPWAGDLVCALALDLPTTVTTVDPKAVERWGLPVEELFRTGERNVLAEGLIEAKRINGPKGEHLYYLAADTFFVSAHALFLERYLGTPSEHGALVAVPTRHVLLFHHIADMTVVPTIQWLITTAMNLHEKGPGSLSFQLYWWTPTSVMCLPIRLEGGQIVFQPPDEFVQRVLNPLAARGSP